MSKENLRVAGLTAGGYIQYCWPNLPVGNPSVVGRIGLQAGLEVLAELACGLAWSAGRPLHLRNGTSKEEEKLLNLAVPWSAVADKRSSDKF